MKEDLNIEELFKQGFENFEGNVDPSAWANISQNLNTGLSGGTTGTTGLSVFGKVAVIVGAVATTSMGIWYFTSTARNSGVDSDQTQVTDNTVNKSGEASGNTITVNGNDPEGNGERVQDNDEAQNNNLSESRDNQTVTDPIISHTSTGPVDDGSISDPDDGLTGDPVDDGSTGDLANDVPTVVDTSETGDTEEAKRPSIKASPEWEIIQKNEVRFISNAENHDKVVWKLGDGTVLEGNDVTHVYTRPGMYAVEVEISQIQNESVKREARRLTVEIKGTSEITFIPNIFSPNNDNDNDFFDIQSKGIEEFNIIIYDLSGKEVFQSNDPDFRWNGELPDGSKKAGKYGYVINAVGEDGRLIPKQGMITVVL